MMLKLFLQRRFAGSASLKYLYNLIVSFTISAKSTFYNLIYMVLLWYECKELHSFSFQRVIRAFELINESTLSLFLLFVGIATVPLLFKLSNKLCNVSRKVAVC